MDKNSLPRHTNRRNGNNLFLGLILILIGILFLMQQIGSFNFRNWWALFILIPSFGSFSTAWYAFQKNYRINEGVRAGLGAGLITLTLALIFLFNLNWSTWWPMMIIVPGLVTIFNGITLPGSREQTQPLSSHIFRPWSGWIGAGMLFLGSGFLAKNLGLIDPTMITRNWWAIAILIPAIGGTITAIRMAASENGWNWIWGWVMISNLVTTAVFIIVGSVALLGISWNLLGPVLMIAIGIILLMRTLKKQK
jgi:hypothetical protein